MIKKLYDRKEIARILDRFMDGETSLDEEKMLAEYLRTHEVSEEWQEYKEMFSLFDKGEVDIEKDNSAPILRTSRHNWLKIAAFFIGILFISGITLAAIRMVKNSWQQTSEAGDDTKGMGSLTIAGNKGLGDVEVTDTIQPVVYDNIPLEKMLPEIATYYNTKVTFINDANRQLRFRFVWYPQKGISQVVNDLNQFKRLTVTLRDDQITVE
jgi:ferric-dicitrate binding protein FerR (iron transport regulator)